jgi:hypothetical protein
MVFGSVDAVPWPMLLKSLVEREVIFETREAGANVDPVVELFAVDVPDGLETNFARMINKTMATTIPLDHMATLIFRPRRSSGDWFDILAVYYELSTGQTASSGSIKRGLSWGLRD